MSFGPQLMLDIYEGLLDSDYIEMDEVESETSL